MVSTTEAHGEVTDTGYNLTELDGSQYETRQRQGGGPVSCLNFGQSETEWVREATKGKKIRKPDMGEENWRAMK